MNIKQKLTWAFAIIACLPVVLVATLVVLNLRSDARDDFVDSSGREIRQVSNAMQLFFDYLKGEMAARLRVAGLTLKDLHERLRGWNEIHARYKRNPTAKLKAEIGRYHAEKMKPLMMAIRPDLCKDD